MGTRYAQETREARRQRERPLRDATDARKQRRGAGTGAIQPPEQRDDERILDTDVLKASAARLGRLRVSQHNEEAAAEGSGLMRKLQVRAQQVKQVARPQRCFESQRDQSANFEPRPAPYEAERYECAR